MLVEDLDLAMLRSEDETALLLLLTPSHLPLDRKLTLFFLSNPFHPSQGTVHSDSDMLIALNSAKYDNGAHCGKQVEIWRTDDSSKKVKATVQDSCPTCVTTNSIDLSKAAFLAIATEAEGMVSDDSVDRSCSFAPSSAPDI